MSKIAAIVVGFFFFCVAFATTIYKVTIPEVYKESKLVVYGRIEVGRVLANDCGVEYAVRVQTSFKGGSDPGELLWFQNNGVTQIGSEYFLFLSATGKEFSPIASTNSGATSMRDKYIERCKDNHPPYTVNVFGNGALKATGTYNESVPRAVVIDNAVLIPPEGLKITKFGPYDRYDNDRDDTALDSDEFMQYMKRLSDAH